MRSNEFLPLEFGRILVKLQQFHLVAINHLDVLETNRGVSDPDVRTDLAAEIPLDHMGNIRIATGICDLDFLASPVEWVSLFSQRLQFRLARYRQILVQLGVQRCFAALQGLGQVNCRSLRNQDNILDLLQV